MPTTTRYGLTVSAQSEDENLLLIEMEAIRRGGHWVKDNIPAGEGLTAHYKNACRLIWPHIDWHRWTELGNSEIRRQNAKVTVLMGCGCVAGHTRILNPITGEQPTIRELYEKQIAPVVMTIHGPAQAEVPFIKEVDDLYEVVLGNGSNSP